MDKIVLFAKAPVPGRVKTRLCPPLTPEKAAGLYAAFSRDAWAAASAVPKTEAVVALDGGDDAEWLGKNVPFVPQKGKDLGQRMHNAFLDAFAGSARKCVVIGTDCPTLTAADIRAAFAALERRDLVLGPARDGGYYLIGLTRPRPELFKGIAWSAPDVLERTLTRAAGLGYALLRPRRDIDTPADLRALKRRRSAGASFTRKALRTLLGLSLLIPAAPAAGRVFSVDDFSAPPAEDGLPQGWKHLTFRKIKRRTRYTVEKDGASNALKAVSERSASALAREVSVNLTEFPKLNWSWKVSGVLSGADGSRKSGDDYPARVYVAFAYDPARATRWEKAAYGLLKAVYGAYPPKATLSYVWDAKSPIGSSWDNAYTNRVKMVVVESGPAKAGRWVDESRDVLADYRRLVGGEPPPIAYIGLMSDSDDTKESATAWFGRLFFSNGDAEEFN